MIPQLTVSVLYVHKLQNKGIMNGNKNTVDDEIIIKG